MAQVAGVILTGGASRRLGRDKAALFAPRVAEVLSRVADPVLEIGPGRTSLTAIGDPGRGPLAALACAPARDTLVLACDLPRITIDVLAWLADHAGTVVPGVEGRAQYRCARYSEATLRLAAHIDGARMTDLLDAADDVSYLDASAWPADIFADVDTPDDLARLQ